MFLTLEDEEGIFDLTVFEDLHARYAKKILASTVLLVEGVLKTLTIDIYGLSRLSLFNTYHLAFQEVDRLKLCRGH